MKGTVILLDARLGAAKIVDGVLEDLMLSAPGPWPGDVLTAKIGRPAGGAAFAEANGVALFVKDAKGLAQGTKVPAMITGFAEPGKAAPATTRVIHKRRRVIHTPHAPGANVSRAIKDREERERLAAALADIADRGFVIRSAAEGGSTEELRRQAEDAMAAPGGGGPLATAAQEWCWPVPDAILLANGAAAPEDADLSAISEPADPDLFDQFGVLDDIDRLRQARFDLHGGGFLTIEATRALVAVDVNTGSDFSQTAGRTANLSACRALPTLLRLKGLGGQIVVDFAPLGKRDRPAVESALKAALKEDPVDTILAGWTPLGNLELQRKRERRPLSEVSL